MNSNRSRNRIRPALLALLLLPLALIAVASILSTPAQAQDVTGSLQGTVLSPEKAPEPDVHITVSGPHLQGVRGTMTDRHGFYQFLTLPPGTYELRIGRIGSRPIEVKGVVVELGRTTAIAPLTLTPQAIQLEPVEIVAPAVTLDPVQTTMGGVLKAEDYAALPVDRDYKSILTILPQANDSHRGDPVNVAGSTGLENQYYIDGMNVTDSKAADRATSLPYNFVRNVNVRTGSYQAQYGRAMGAVVDAVTYSGTNKFEANIFGVTQPSALAMDAKAAPVISEEGPVYYEYGGRISGPLVQDQLWYSVALNPRVDNVDKEISGLGFYPDETTAIRFASKLTWRASSATNLELSVFGDPTERDRVTAPAQGIGTINNADILLSHLTKGGTIASLRATFAPSSSIMLQGIAGKQWDRSVEEGATTRARTEPSYVDYVENFMEGGFGSETREDRGRTSLSAQGTLTLPRHTVIMGVDYVDLLTKSQQSTTDPGNISRLDTSLWFVNRTGSSGEFHNRSPATYIQDTWRVTDRLAVNAGLRWSAQYLVGASGRTAQQITDEWQPRCGFSWQLGEGGTQRILGSYGRYYQALPTGFSTWWFVDFHQVISYYSTDPRQPGAVPDSSMDISTYESDFAKQIPGLEAENFDEFTLGYERLIGQTTVTLRGMRRNLRSSFQWGQDLSLPQLYVFGTPGKGDFSFLPPPKRQYTSLEIAAEGSWSRLAYRASYVLSRSWGNYPGLYDPNWETFGNGAQSTFLMPHQAVNSTGLLPNDHPHVFKLSTAYTAPFHVTCGTILNLEAGSPINDFGPNPTVWSWLPAFVTQRGTSGRTPFVWNLDLRLAYDLPVTRGAKTRVQLDVLHIGNPQSTVQVDEWHYDTLETDGTYSSPNSNYKKPTEYQPPTAVRLGMEVSF